MQRLITFMIHYFQSTQKEVKLKASKKSSSDFQGTAPRITIGGKRPYETTSNPLMLTDGSKRMSADEYTPNSTSYDQVFIENF